MNENFVAGFAAANLIAQREVNDPEAQRRIALLGAMLPMPVGLVVAQQLSNAEAQAEARKTAAAQASGDGKGTTGTDPGAASGSGSGPEAGGAAPPSPAPSPQPDPSAQVIERLDQSADRIAAAVEAGGKRLLASMDTIATVLKTNSDFLTKANAAAESAAPAGKGTK